MVAFLQWQLLTVQCFTEQYQQRPRTERLNEIEHLWNWNHRDKEAIFFGGAARPLHLKTVTEFSALMNSCLKNAAYIGQNMRSFLALDRPRLSINVCSISSFETCEILGLSTAVLQITSPLCIQREACLLRDSSDR